MLKNRFYNLLPCHCSKEWQSQRFTIRKSRRAQ